MRKSRQILIAYVTVSNFRPGPNFSAKALRAFAQLLPPWRGKAVFPFHPRAFPSPLFLGTSWGLSEVYWGLCVATQLIHSFKHFNACGNPRAVTEQFKETFCNFDFCVVVVSKCCFHWRHAFKIRIYGQPFSSYKGLLVYKSTGLQSFLVFSRALPFINAIRSGQTV